ncbi:MULTISPECIES: L-2-amino-thiazoline-4-carboxylic acid hydrolase [Brenneria]|uniref:L-2-amino-thiazoline-4-carboxylic acid hydrolase n=1 Tax=Brenneria nigrifluens DSM 30175 = ATCC 13028 TaxID=1121120 RepID=A0A2U1UVL8_9GAMM|nr:MULTISPECIES: L-2-amino-thiazoline-4-carboxylic acid hydrolase [Brenneria]EHD20224.1 hypothetical protein BrE312_0783 [Brenneria sp. EniD312]PWC25687.1 hypothetical protein DDT54_03175 [Brenneria nigrifluens DSM 30175 = ATCC 13028]QCR03448.1 hypothetical protein EH206_04005 [Brenneria nigrifluens DSM 30175 = ATCC 13028]
MENGVSMTYHNTPNLTDEVTLALRAITEKRAATIAYMLDEAKRYGLDDRHARDAIAHYGRDNGRKMVSQMQNPNDIHEFAAIFTAGLESKVYEMQPISLTDNEFIVHFHYCPYVNKWLEQEKAPDEIHQLCDICMEGDNAITDAFPNLMFVLGNTIAKGGAVCELCYKKRS